MKIHKLAIVLGLVTLMAACSSKAYLQRGNNYYNSGRFYQASEMYQKAYKGAPSDQMKADVAFLLGNSFEKVNKTNNAARWYRMAIRSRDTFSNAVLALARCELINQKVDEAQENFMQFQELKPGNNEGNAGLRMLSRMEQWVKHPTKYQVSYAKEFNTKGNAFGAVYMGRDTNIVLLASSGRRSKKGPVDMVTGAGYSNIYEIHYSNEVKRISKRKKGKKRGKTRVAYSDRYRWSRPNKLNDTINSKYNEGAISFSHDGNVMLFTSSRKMGKNHLGTKIYSVDKRGDGWGEAKTVEIASDSLSVGHPSLSSQGDRLYFASDMPGGMGGKDIWMVKKEGSGWGEPINLGKGINTPGNEMFPFIREDGVLFFSSNFRDGLGGLDIYQAQQDAKGSWMVENMGYPINSAGDDFGIIFQPGKKRGLFTSSRKRGNDNIYRFKWIPTLFLYKGQVRDEDTKQMMSGVTIQIISSQGEQKNIKSDENGSFSLKLNSNSEYIIVASHTGYLNGKDQVSTVELEQSKVFNGVIDIKAIEKPIELPNIFYDFARWELRDVSKEALDGLVGVLNDNPNITIELGSHTDRVGGDRFNMELSQKRAQSVVDYLIEKGIYWDRLQARGYGKSNPKVVDAPLALEYNFLKEGVKLDASFIETLSKDRQEQANQINRRTEFRVLSTDYKPGPQSKKRPGIDSQGTTLVKELNKVKGVFYTVQIGVFSKGSRPDVIEQFQVVFRENIDPGKVRYTTGVFDSYKMAKQEAQKISHKGIKAFVVAYNNGKKITFDQAKKLKQ